MIQFDYYNMSTIRHHGQPYLFVWRESAFAKSLGWKTTHDKMKSWLLDTFGCDRDENGVKWTITPMAIAFRDQEDALWFRLAWTGDNLDTTG